MVNVMQIEITTTIIIAVIITAITIFIIIHFEWELNFDTFYMTVNLISFLSMYRLYN